MTQSDDWSTRFSSVKNKLEDYEFPSPVGYEIPTTLDVEASTPTPVRQKPTQPKPSSPSPQKPNPQPRKEPQPAFSGEELDGEGERVGARVKSDHLQGLKNLFSRFKPQPQEKKPTGKKPAGKEANEVWARFVSEVPKYFSLLVILSYLVHPFKVWGLTILSNSIYSLLTPLAFLPPFLLAGIVLARLGKWQQVEFCIYVVLAYLVKLILIMLSGL